MGNLIVEKISKKTFFKGRIFLLRAILLWIILLAFVAVLVNIFNARRYDPIDSFLPCVFLLFLWILFVSTIKGYLYWPAMNDFNGEGTGQILVFIKNGSGNGTKIADLLPGVNENAKDFANQILTQLMWQKNNLALTDLSEIITDRLVAGVEIITPKIVTDKTQTKNLCIGEENNETCITKSQLDQILLKMNMETTTTPSGTPIPTPTGVGVTLDTTTL